MTGTRLLMALIAALIALTAARILAGGLDAESLGRILRDTARASGLLAGAAFVAPAWARVFPGGLGAWLESNERTFFLGFTVSHLLHLVAIGAAAKYGALTEKESSESFVLIGIFTYAVMLALAALSFARTAPLIERAPWRRLHAAGMYYLWLAFAVSWARHVEGPDLYAALTILALAALALRVVAAVRGARPA